MLMRVREVPLAAGRRVATPLVVLLLLALVHPSPPQGDLRFLGTACAEGAGEPSPAGPEPTLAAAVGAVVLSPPIERAATRADDPTVAVPSRSATSRPPRAPPAAAPPA